MKEAMWGVLILTLGLLGIVIIQIFQNITVTNDQTYFLLKEVTEASMFDSIDLAYYRTKGKIRIIEDKFVENFARRFAESTIQTKEYNIRIHDIIEEPPKVSLSIGTYVLSLQGDNFKIGQSLDAIIETKYGKDEIEGTPTIDPTDPEDPADPEDPEEENTCPKCEAGDPNCSQETQCITGDLKFKGWGTTNIPGSVCPTDILGPKTKDANYQSCECGRWKDMKEPITVNPVRTAIDYTYTWRFIKESEIRKIDVSDTEKAVFDKCVEDIEIEVPDPDEDEGVACPPGGIKIVVGQNIILTPVYIPSDAVNRGLIWISSDNSITTVQYPLPTTIGPKGISRATVTGIKKGTSTITVKTTNNITDTCNVEVVDWECPTTKTEMDTNSTKQATIKDGIVLPEMKWSIDNINIATINSTGLITSKDTATEISYKVDLDKLKTLVCPLKINAKTPEDEEETPTTKPSGCTPGSISVDWNTNNLKVPALCPQDFETQTVCSGTNCSEVTPALSKLGTMQSEASYCGRYGGYTYPEKSRWDYSQNITNVVFLGSKIINEPSGTYKITLSRNFDYDFSFWNKDVAPYIRGLAGVTRTHTVTGTLKSRSSAECVAVSGDVKPFMFITGSEAEMVVGTEGIQLSVSQYPATAYGIGKWTTSNSKILTVNNGYVAATGEGTATITYSAPTTYKGVTTTTTATTTIKVYGSCSSLYISAPSSVTKGDDFSAKVNPQFGGASYWTSSNTMVAYVISNPDTLTSVVKFTARQKGMLTITATRAVDNCKKTKIITVNSLMICPKDTYVEYPLNTDYCYNKYKSGIAAFVCSSSGTYKYPGYNIDEGKTMCYSSLKAAQLGGNDCIVPSVCNPWKTGKVGNVCRTLYRKVEE